eukprot:scaffold264238_cov22-Tisochrysis_lutea.AAC.2
MHVGTLGIGFMRARLLCVHGSMHMRGSMYARTSGSGYMHARTRDASTIVEFLLHTSFCRRHCRSACDACAVKHLPPAPFVRPILSVLCWRQARPVLISLSVCEFFVLLAFADAGTHAGCCLTVQTL